MKKKYYSWDECINLQEVKSLRKMNHPSIVKLKEVIREYDILYFVFKNMECNLYQLRKDWGKLFSGTEVRNWCFQPPYIEYISTLWYRAPEVLLQSSTYNFAVDMWAMGAIMAELFTLEPLFPCLREPDLIYKICKLAGVHLLTLIPSASENVISPISSLCSWDPSKRPTAAKALQHPFFLSSFYISPSLRSRVSASRTPPTIGTRAVLDQKSTSRRYYGTLSSMKPTNSFSSAKAHTYLSSGVQRNLKMDYQQQAGCKHE
ncbi:hypothetical protein GIB67_016671 [Kingdonia uniflora]|uniref:Protein kinase domain-containing protein n=1 Tax=Kingdonia uniflora TaxID=39325 RepID=A0A7J7MEG1_9MAGN|nr:hypothetical protein GIB67_016671 [Kingdonia uniflora]